MTTRKASISEERRQQIIDGALAVFSTRGFTQATNKDIAEAAGINSPGLIYHYFADKAALLRAVIERYAPPFQLIAQADEFMGLPVEEALTRFSLAYLRLIDDPKMGACMKVLMSEAMHHPEFARMLGEAGPLRVWQLLAQYLGRKMDEGALRRTDPMIAARCFAGPLVLTLMTHKVFQLAEAMTVDPTVLVKTSVDIFLRGLQVELGVRGSGFGDRENVQATTGSIDSKCGTSPVGAFNDPRTPNPDPRSPNERGALTA